MHNRTTFSPTAPLLEPLGVPDAWSDNSLRGQFLFLGTGTSHGVPVIGCECATCQSGDPRDQRTRSSAVVGLPEGNLLIDTPPDLRAQLLREGIGRIHAVVYTHEHADHLFGLDDLRIFAQYLGADLPLYCTEAVEARIRQAFDYAFDPVVRAYPAGGVPRLEFRRIGDAPFHVLGAEIMPVPLRHGRSTVLGYRIGRLAYCTDCNAIEPASRALLDGLDVLVLDCLRRRPHPTHFHLEESLRVAGEVGAPRTLFTHIAHDLTHADVSAELPPGVELACDGLRVPLHW
ncbi:MAG: MBL fold metallo-hydrolase [Planctomycetota bacterium]